MRAKGIIRSWNDQKGFGFIQPTAGGKDVFLHISAFRSRDRRPQAGQLVAYTLTSDERGRPKAARAALEGRNPVTRKRHGGAKSALLTAGLFLCLVLVLVYLHMIPAPILWLYLGASIITFLAYAIDKNAARNGSWRTKESFLHWLSLIGGWPGALLAQQALRHKSRKQPFRSIFWGTVSLNVLILGWMLTSSGAGFVETWVGGSTYHLPVGESAHLEWATPPDR